MPGTIANQAGRDIQNYALSFLLVGMGEHIPETLWGVDDYSVLYGIIDEANDRGELDLTSDG